MSHSYPSDISREQFARMPTLESARRRTSPAPWTCMTFSAACCTS